MKRLTVFHGTKANFVQAVITEDVLPQFKKLGFVCCVDDLKAARKTAKAAKNAD